MTEEENISTIITIQEPIIQITENGVEGFEILCRLCANRSDHLIPIYSEEGVTNDLAEKMNLYLPVKVSRDDVLPLQCCFQCASTVLTWHELVVASVEADRRLRDVQSEVEKQIAQHNLQVEEPGPSQIEEVDERSHRSLNLKLKRKRKQKEEVQIKLEPETETTIELSENDQKFDLVPKIYQCHVCSKYLAQKTSLVRHLRIHKNERPCTCESCGKSFRDRGAVIRHINHVHKKTKDFPCEFCDQKFASAATRDDHRRKHTKECPFECEKCGKKFNRKASLYIHSKIHSDVFPFPCSVCDKKFRRRQELNNHITIHSGEKRFKCDTCEKSFRLRSDLTAHMFVHSEKKPFRCEICGNLFKQSRYLRRHKMKCT